MGSTIVGVTDSGILGQLDEAFSAALFLSPSAHTVHSQNPQPNSNKADSRYIEKAISKAMKPKAGATIVTFANMSGSRSAAASSSQGRKVAAHLSASFRLWAVDGCKQSQLVVRHEPTGYNISKLLLKVRSLPSKDRVLLGDMLLRDNLRDLTLGFFRSEDIDRDAARRSNLTGPASTR